MSDKVTAAELLADIDSPDFEAEQLILRATELLIDLMERQGITRSELAERIGKTKGYVSQIFSGQRNMTMRTLAEIGYALGYRFEVQPWRTTIRNFTTRCGPGWSARSRGPITRRSRSTGCSS